MIRELIQFEDTKYIRIFVILCSVFVFTLPSVIQQKVVITVWNLQLQCCLTTPENKVQAILLSV